MKIKQQKGMKRSKKVLKMKRSKLAKSKSSK